MTTHQMKLSAKPFEKIVNGEKTIESRLYDKKRQRINIGDQIQFTCNNDTILTKVKALYKHKSFRKLFSDFAPEHFGGISRKELIQEIKTFYSKKDQRKYGVVGIKIDKI